MKSNNQIKKGKFKQITSELTCNKKLLRKKGSFVEILGTF